MNCVFCKSHAGIELASIIYKDEYSMAIVPFHSPYPESAVVFPNQHIDHFTDPGAWTIHVNAQFSLAPGMPGASR